MPPDRQHLAQLAYDRAITLARERATRSAWARLLRAAKNLRAARERSGPREARAGAPARTCAQPAVTPRPPRPTAPLAGAGAEARHRLSRPAAPTTRREAAEAFAALRRELDRSTALVARSRALVREAATLCADLAALGAARAWPPG